MGKTLVGLTVTLFAFFAATNASAAFVTDTADGALSITGGTPFTTSAEGDPGGFPDGNYVFGALGGYTGATLEFDPNQNYIFEYMGKEAGDTNTFTLGSYGSFNTDSTSKGEKIIVSSTDASSWAFDGNNSSEATDPSDYIFMAVEGNSVWLGFDDRADPNRHIDYDDLVVRVSAASAVPVPAAIWLFGSALIGFVGMSRKTKV